MPSNYVVLILFLMCISILAQRNISPDDCPNTQCFNGGYCINNVTNTCQCTPNYQYNDCSVQSKHTIFDSFLGCKPNSNNYDPTTKICACKPGWSGDLCKVCEDDATCRTKYPGSNSTYHCEKSLYDYGYDKAYHCKMTDLSFENLFNGVKMDTHIYCENNSTKDRKCHLEVYTTDAARYIPVGHRRQIFWCYYKNCVQKLVEENNQIIIRRECNFTHCDCTGNFPCPLPLQWILHAMKTTSRFDCINGTNRCVIEQKEMPFTMRLNCTAGACVPEPQKLPDPIKPVPKNYFSLYIVSASFGLVGLAIIVIIFLYFLWSKYQDHVLNENWKLVENSESDIFYFYNIAYTIKTWFGEKRILHNLSGEFHPGSIVAIMGSSGSGKTSFMDILASRNKSGKVEGALYYGEEVVSKSFNRISGYVYQDVEMMSTMTVRECLWFSANLRLPEYFDHKEKAKRISETLIDLNIAHIVDSKISVISGGEKKRVAIAMEMVIQPPILFLDECTTGLDSFNAEQVMICLKNLAKKGKTIVLSIHQPSSSIFSLFDHLILLTEGKMAYFGPADEVVNHFNNLGYKLPKQHSIPDFIIDLLENASRNKEKMQNDSTEIDFLINSFHDKYHIVTEFTNPNLGDIGVNESYKDQHLAPVPIKIQSEFNTSFFGQFMILASRSVKNIVRNPLLLPGHVLLSCLVGFIIGWSFWQTPLDLRGVQNRIGIIFISTLVLALASMTALEIFIQERILYVRERSNGMYSAWAYYFSKILFDVIPLRVIPPVLMGSILYWMVGLRGEAEAFLWFISILVLFNVVCGGICFVIAAFVEGVAMANFVALVVFLFSVLFGGFLINTTNRNIRWFRYLSVFQYAVESLMSNELMGRLVWFNPDSRGGVWARGEAILETFAMNGEHFAMNFGILIGLSFVTIALAGIIVRFCSREKR